MEFLMFIDKIKDMLDLQDYKKNFKEKSIQELVGKLEERKQKLSDSIKKADNKKDKQTKKDELAVIVKEIKKGQKLLKKLKAQSK